MQFQIEIMWAVISQRWFELLPSKVFFKSCYKDFEIKRFYEFLPLVYFMLSWFNLLYIVSKSLPFVIPCISYLFFLQAKTSNIFTYLPVYIFKTGNKWTGIQHVCLPTVSKIFQYRAQFHLRFADTKVQSSSPFARTISADLSSEPFEHQIYSHPKIHILIANETTRTWDDT